MSVHNLESVLALITSSTSHPVIIRITREAAGSRILPALGYDRWHDVSAPEYLMILPALRLASQILLSPRALQFFHARLRGRTGTTQDDRGVHQSRFSRDDRNLDTALSPEETAYVLRHLHDLAPRLQFGRLKNAHGICQPQAGERIHHLHAGVRSNITLASKYLNELNLVHENGPPILKRWTTMAITLCHELCHAFNAAIDGPSVEPFFEDDSFSEMGHAFEKFVLGGNLEAHRNPEGELKLLSGVWTAEHMAEQHARCGFYVPTTGRVTESESGPIILVEDAWTERLFDETFWSVQVPSDGGQTLRVRPENQSPSLIAERAFEPPAREYGGDARLQHLYELLYAT